MRPSEVAGKHTSIVLQPSEGGNAQRGSPDRPRVPTTGAYTSARPSEWRSPRLARMLTKRRGRQATRQGKQDEMFADGLPTQTPNANRRDSGGGRFARATWAPLRTKGGISLFLPGGGASLGARGRHGADWLSVTDLLYPFQREQERPNRKTVLRSRNLSSRSYI